MTSENRTRACEWVIPPEELLKALQETGRLPTGLKASTRTPGEQGRLDEVEFAIAADGHPFGPRVRGPVIACWTERDPRLSDRDFGVTEPRWSEEASE